MGIFMCRFALNGPLRGKYPAAVLSHSAACRGGGFGLFSATQPCRNMHCTQNPLVGAGHWPARAGDQWSPLHPSFRHRRNDEIPAPICAGGALKRICQGCTGEVPRRGHNGRVPSLVCFSFHILFANTKRIWPSETEQFHNFVSDNFA